MVQLFDPILGSHFVLSWLQKSNDRGVKNVSPGFTETKKVWPFSGPNFGDTFSVCLKTGQNKKRGPKIGAVF